MSSATATPRKDPKTGTWWFVVDLPAGPGGRRRQARRRGFPTKKDAQAALDQLRVGARTGTYVAPARQTFSNFLKIDWLPVIRRSWPKAPGSLTSGTSATTSNRTSVTYPCRPSTGPLEPVPAISARTDACSATSSRFEASDGPLHPYDHRLGPRRCCPVAPCAAERGRPGHTAVCEIGEIPRDAGVVGWARWRGSYG